jgi:general secretion pathway protein G
VPGDGQPFDLLSLGKDGKPGGDSVDADVKYQQ